MPRKCCVPGCTSNYNSSAGKYINVFSFPKDPHKRKQWLRAIHRELCRGMYYSEQHILREDTATQSDGSILVMPRKIPKLAEDACPSTFSNLPFFISSEPAPKRKDPGSGSLVSIMASQKNAHVSVQASWNNENCSKTGSVPSSASNDGNRKANKRRTYSVANLQNAVEKVLNDNWTVYKAAKECGVPWSTLKDHISRYVRNADGDYGPFEVPKLGRPFVLPKLIELRSHEERIVTGAQQKQSLQEYEDRSSNLYEDQQQIPELLEVESKPLLEIPLITLTHTQEDDFENRITGEVQSSGMAPQTSEFRLPETITLQRVTRKSDNIRITGDVQSSGMAPQTSEFRPPETLPMPRLARKLDSIRQVSTSEPGPSTQNPPVTVVCAPELSTMKSSSQPSETSEDPLALLSDPTYEPRTVRPRRFQNASKSVSITLGPKPLSSRNEVTVEYFGGGSETNVNATEEYEEQQQDGRNIEKVLLQLRAEKLLLEMEKLKQERLKMEAEKRNIKLRNEILSLRIQLAKPQDTISSSDHPTTTRTTRESSSNLTTSVSVQRELSQNTASSATTKHLPLQEESLRISCVPQQSSSSNKSSQCQSSSPDVTSAKCQTYEHAAHPATGGKERTSKKSNETRQFSSERVKEDYYKASSMPVKSSDEELTRKTRIDCSKSEQVSLPTPYLKEEGEEHFSTEQALFYSAVHGERDVERDATLLVGSLDRSGLSDSSIHESDSILEVESMCRSRDLGCGREETQRGGGFPVSKGESLVGQSDTNTDTVRTEQRKKSHGSFQQMSPVIGSREKVGEVGSFHFHDVYSKKSESKRLFESADSCALNEEGTVVKKKRVESIGRVQSSGVE